MTNVVPIFDEQDLKEKAQAEFINQRVNNISQIAKKLRVPKETLERWRDGENWIEQRRVHLNKRRAEIIERLGESPEEGAIKAYNLAVEIRHRAVAYLKTEQRISLNGLSSILKAAIDAEKVCQSALQQLGL